MTSNILASHSNTNNLSNRSTGNKVGLVLSGGGAKGAYHAGVLKAMNKLNMPVDMVAGASIGALNGAIIASAPNFATGVKRVLKVWDELPVKKPIEFKGGLPFTSASEAGFMSKDSLKYLLYLPTMLSFGLRVSLPVSAVVTTLFPSLRPVDIDNLLKDDVLHGMVNDYLDLDTLQHALPLFISVFEQNYQGGNFDDFVHAIKDTFNALVLGIDNQPATFRHIQSLPINEQKDFILASASLPMLFKAYQNSQGERLTDGGQGGYVKSQGNTPITPLIEAGCNYVVVVHVSDGSLWHRHDFPNTAILEVRPSIQIGGTKAMFDFSEPTIHKLINTGYADAMRVFEVRKDLAILQNSRNSQQRLQEVMSDTTASDTLANAMNRLRSRK